MTPTPEQNAKRVPAPRTDAQTFIAGHQDWEGECVTAEFSRTLETELAELRQAADGMARAAKEAAGSVLNAIHFDEPEHVRNELERAVEKLLDGIAAYRALAGEGGKEKDL